MRFPIRYTLPVLLAVICAGMLLVFLWWQLMQSSEMLKRGPDITSGLGTLPETTMMTDTPIDPRDRALLHLRQGDLFALRGEWADAQKEYEEAVKADGGLPAIRKLAQAQLQRRDISAVRSTIKKMRSNGARSEDLLLLESIVELRTGELVKARSLLEGADDSPQKHYGLALLSMIEGNHEASQAELTEVANGWEPVLRSYSRTLQSAYDEFTLFPESPDIHLVTLLSRALAQVQECELALPLLVQVTQVQDDYRDAWIVQGYCELTTEREAQALASLERAYSLDPQKPEIQYFLARTYAAMDDHGNAITFFEYSLTNGFKPASEVRRRIAISALEEGSTDLALEQYEKLSEEEDSTIEPYEGYVAASIATGHVEQAYLFAEKAVERFPESGRAHELLGWAAAESGQTEKAREELEKAVDLNPYLTSAKEKLNNL